MSASVKKIIFKNDICLEVFYTEDESEMENFASGKNHSVEILSMSNNIVHVEFFNGEVSFIPMDAIEVLDS